MSNRDQPPPSANEKGFEAGEYAQEFRRNNSITRAPLPHELTAEWTVNAQLKFARAGETVEKKFSTNDAVQPVRVLYKWSTNDDNASSSCPQFDDDARSQNPRKSTKNSEIQKDGSFRSTASSITCREIGRADSAFSSSNNSNKLQNGTLTPEIKNFYGTRCQSTCNITVTAVADFLSPADIIQQATESQQNESKPFVFNTTASCYTVQPEKPSCSKEKKRTNFRDAVCQTSDIETKHFGQFARKRNALERRDSRKSYDYKRTTVDDVVQKPGYINRANNEDNSFLPSQIPSSVQTSKSSLTPGVSSLIGGESVGACAAEKPAHFLQKKPRTVHIDVYCTGSEDDEQADAESSSDSKDDDKLNKIDQESNSTFQTVLENEQMRLRHQRIIGSSLPRRLADNSGAALLSSQISDNSHHALTKSSTADEIQESKQLLFRKHVGDQRAVKLQNLRQKYLRQSSDDTLSFGYPNSSRSTVRDNTCSSISSLLAGQDIAEASCKETGEPDDLLYSLTKSDSFEYENALDRLRIRQMERLWSRSLSNEDETKLPGSSTMQHESSNLRSISETTTSPRKSPNPLVVLQEETFNSDLDVFSELDHNTDTALPIHDDATNYKFQQTSHFSRNKPGFLHFFGPNLENSQPTDEPQSVPVIQNDSIMPFSNYDSGLQRWKSETRENLSASATPALSRQASPQPHPPHQTSPCNKNFQRSGSETPMSTTVVTPTPARRFDMHSRPSPAISESSTQPPPFGYSLEYLDKAKMFGKVVAARKPGHHIGPTKNPNCSCESCRRWFAERFQTRGRIFSLGEMPALKRPS